jgi:hypothetical protein
MATAQDIMNAAGRLIGELRADRTFGTNESAQLLVSLNQMLGEWSQEQFGIHQITRDSHTVSGSALASVTIGASGTINTARPIRITAAEVISANSIPRAAAVVTADQWAARRGADDTATSDWADVVFPDYGFTQTTVRVHPKINIGSALVLYSLKPLTEFSLVSTTVSMPPGYEEALVYNFAVKIAPDFGKAAPQHVAEIADRARKAIAATNAQMTPAAGA